MLKQKSLLLRKAKEEEDTVQIAGREVTIAQQPFIHADIKAARKVLDKLAAFSKDKKVSNYTEIHEASQSVTSKVYKI